MKNLSRKEAMEILNDMKVKIEIPKAAVMQNKRNAALDMAIEALRCSETPNTSDTISRQKAVEVLHFWEKKYIWDEDCLNEDAKDIVVSPSKMIEKLPSAQPIQTASNYLQSLPISPLLVGKMPSAQPEIIRCKDCRHNHDCNIQYHAQAGEEFYCGAAERREE